MWAFSEFETQQIVTDYFNDIFTGKQISYKKRLASIQRASLYMYYMQVTIR